MNAKNQAPNSFGQRLPDDNNIISHGSLPRSLEVHKYVCVCVCGCAATLCERCRFDWATSCAVCGLHCNITNQHLAQENRDMPVACLKLS